MNPPSLLQIVERLERLAGRLPSKIQKAVLRELTPLKQLFLQQRPPRFLFVGASGMPMGQIIGALFAPADVIETRDASAPPICRWYDVSLPDRGTISVLDARGADDSALGQLQDELKYQAADIIFFLSDERIAQGPDKHDLDDLKVRYFASNKTAEMATKIVGISILPAGETVGPNQINLAASRLQLALRSNVVGREPVLETLRLISAGPDQGLELHNADAQRLMSTLARELPNQARLEMIRISRNREAQHEVAQLLVKSTTAICAAIGAQPILLADLPILTSLQVTMISGIMYVSGRERSLRAATEFIGALGVNVGAAMLLREGARAVLKFFPGWGNVVGGLVAGSGTYAIGRAATVFFIDGVSLKDARRTYRTSRKNASPKSHRS